jgi:hypothetical protein
MSVANLAFDLQAYVMEGPVLRFQAIGITSKYVPKEFIGQLAETAKNKEIRFRHISPDDQVESYLGRILDTKIQDGTMLITGEILGNTPEQQGVQQWMREQQAKGEPLGISMGFIITKDEKTDKVIRVDAREASVTPQPKCGECRITKLLNENKNGEMRVMSTNQGTAQQAPTQPSPAPPAPAAAPVPITESGGFPVPQDPRIADYIAELEKKIVLLSSENTALQEFIGEFGRIHDNTLLELEKVKTLPIRNEIASLQRLYGADFLVEVKRLEAMPSNILAEIKDRLTKAKGPTSMQRMSAIPASAALQPQPINTSNMTRDEKAKFAEDYLKRFSKRSVG